MAQRKEARIFVTIWDDPVFRAHSPSAQRMYLYLLSQIDLSYCGVIPLRERRWARDAPGLTGDQVMADVEALAKPFGEGFGEGGKRPLLVVDDDSGEVLIRSLIRNDGIWRQPNLLKAAREAAAPIRSPQIKTALIDELKRLPLEETSSEQVRDVVAEFIADLESSLPPQPSNPSANPFGNPSPDPSQGIGEGNGSSTGDPLTPGNPDPHSPEPPGNASRSSSEIAPRPSDPNRDRPEIDRICNHLADRIAANGSNRPAIGKKWRDAARLMLDRDHRTETQVHAAIDWCQDHEFWRGNILSLPKLREKYDQLSLQARRPQHGNVVHLNGRQPLTGTDAKVAAWMAAADRLDAQENQQ